MPREETSGRWPRGGSASDLGEASANATPRLVIVGCGALARELLALTAGIATMACTSWFSFVTIALGVLAGTASPFQAEASKPGNPASASVGTSGRFAERRSEVTPSARN